MLAYAEKLKDPRWQRRRLEVLSAANFECEKCGSKEKTLHVHHGYYEKGKKPWEYPDDALHCLCEDCHGAAEGLKQGTAKLLNSIGLDASSEVYGYLLGWYLWENQDHQVKLESYEMIQGLSAYWGLHHSVVLKELTLYQGTITGNQLMYLAGMHGTPTRPWIAGHLLIEAR